MKAPETGTNDRLEFEREGAREAETIAVLLDLARRPKARRARRKQVHALAFIQSGQARSEVINPVFVVLSLLAFVALLVVLVRVAA